MDIPAADEWSRSLGWDLDYDFLKEVQWEVRLLKLDVDTPSMEEIEAVLLALKNVHRKRIEE